LKVSEPERASEAIPKAYSPAATSSKTMPNLGKAFNAANGKGLVTSKRRKRMSARVRGPVERTEEERDPLAGNLVDDDELRIVAP